MLRTVFLKDLREDQKRGRNFQAKLVYFRDVLGYKHEIAYELVSIKLEMETMRWKQEG